jgi:16S rRNA (guanine966-N2)-methyltransferase
MRVITGLYKGRILKTVKDLSVRPATDRVKQTVFNMLANRIELQGTNVLDLFAGSGSLGIEALSRGAAHVTFVENGEQAVRYIEENVRTLGCEEMSDVDETDAMYFLSHARSPFDLIFADPPYEFGRTTDIPEMVFERKLLKHHGYLVVEHATSVRFASTRLYHAGPERKFGRTLVTFFRKPSVSPIEPSVESL